MAKFPLAGERFVKRGDIVGPTAGVCWCEINKHSWSHTNKQSLLGSFSVPVVRVPIVCKLEIATRLLQHTTQNVKPAGKAHLDEDRVHSRRGLSEMRCFPFHFPCPSPSCVLLKFEHANCQEGKGSTKARMFGSWPQTSNSSFQGVKACACQ